MKYKHIFRYLLAALWLVALLPLSSCREEMWKEHNRLSTEAGSTLLEVVRANAECSAFYEALVATGYDKVLEQPNSFTVFVPNNSAWQPSASADLNLLVGSHIIYSKRLSSDTSLYKSMQSLSSKQVRYNDLTKTFNGAAILSSDHVASNGVVHIVDKILEVPMSIWEYMNAGDLRTAKQTAFISSLNDSILDVDKSGAPTFDANGNPVYENAMYSYVNSFLSYYAPLNDESQTMTYIVMSDAGYDALHGKYKPYYQSQVNGSYSEEATLATAALSLCADMAFQGLVSISAPDPDGTLTNILGVKVPVAGLTPTATYEASNGRVYVVDKVDILLREKIKPIIIEGENFRRSADNDFVFKRSKPQWASGGYDMSVSSRNVQRDTIPIPRRVIKSDTIKSLVHPEQDSLIVRDTSFVVVDSIRSRTVELPGVGGVNGQTANVINFWVEYGASVVSTPYEIHYVAYDDIAGHRDAFNADGVLINRALRIEQKLFISLPGSPGLAKDGDKVVNNYLGDTICFVGRDTAGVGPKLTRLKKWTLSNNANQLLKNELAGDVGRVEIPYAGNLTMWLCNTTRNTGTKEQGMLFLDYIKLVPILPDE